MIKRIEEKPETYDQSVYLSQDIGSRRDPPCGAVACLAGEAIICSNRSIVAGIAELQRLVTNACEPDYTAALRIGIPQEIAGNLFYNDASGWPQPFRNQFRQAKTYKGEARAAINLLRAILKTDGKVLEQ
jgi:hypothetical protein